MLSYRENNIIFRIASADAISKFKEVQSSSFIQVNRKELNFDLKAKEALLLEYDRFSQLIIKVERLMLMDDMHEISPTLRKLITQLVLDEFDSIEEISVTHKGSFSADITKFLRAIHSYSKPLIVSHLNAALKLPAERAFSAITQTLSNYLQHTLCALHEYDTNIIKEKSPILSYSEFSHSVAGGESVPIIHRANYFLQRGIGSTFELKNYVNSQIDSRIYSDLIKLGVKLTVVESELHFD